MTSRCVLAMRAERQQIGIGDRVGDDQAVRRCALQGATPPRADPARNVSSGRWPTLSRGLPRQPAPDVGIGHRRQRMLLHAGLVQQTVADEQMALDRSCGRSAGKAGQTTASGAPSCVEQRFGHRPDIALRRGIEGRAIFEDDLLGAVAPPASGMPPATAPPLRRPRSSASSGRRPPHRSFRPAAVLSGMPTYWTVRAPALASVLAMSPEPVKSSPMTPIFIRGGRSRAGARTSSSAGRDGRASPVSARSGSRAAIPS